MNLQLSNALYMALALGFYSSTTSAAPLDSASNVTAVSGPQDTRSIISFWDDYARGIQYCEKKMGKGPKLEVLQLTARPYVSVGSKNLADFQQLALRFGYNLPLAISGAREGLAISAAWHDPWDIVYNEITNVNVFDKEKLGSLNRWSFQSYADPRVDPFTVLQRIQSTRVEGEIKAVKQGPWIRYDVYACKEPDFGLCMTFTAAAGSVSVNVLGGPPIYGPVQFNDVLNNGTLAKSTGALNSGNATASTGILPNTSIIATA